MGIYENEKLFNADELFYEKWYEKNDEIINDDEKKILLY